MDTAYVRETPPLKWPYKVQESLHFRYLKLLLRDVKGVTSATYNYINPILRGQKRSPMVINLITKWDDPPSSNQHHEKTRWVDLFLPSGIQKGWPICTHKQFQPKMEEFVSCN